MVLVIELFVGYRKKKAHTAVWEETERNGHELCIEWANRHISLSRSRMPDRHAVVKQDD